MAARRVTTLLDSEAEVTVVAPQVHPDIVHLAEAGRIQLLRAEYRPDVLTEAFLAVIATSDAALNERIAADARMAGCLLNDADEPERGDCLFPAVVRRADLVISVTTGGASPSLAGRIRDTLQEQFGPEYEEYMSVLGEARRNALEAIEDDRARRQALAALAADEDILELIRAGRLDEARAKAHACISSQ